MIAKENTEAFILLAEDSEDDAFFFQRALQKAAPGCPLVRAQNGKIAIELLQNAATRSGLSPVLLFLDLKMPVKSGFEVLEWLRLPGPQPVPKVIVLSGSNDQDDRERALSLGAVDYLVKPITADILREIIAGECDSQQREDKTRVSV